MLQAIRGTKDILPVESGLWQYIEEVFRRVSGLFNYQELRTPIFEYTEVFSRSIGDGTDIVNKEMYTFTDKGDRSVTLRPEQTAALVRSVIQNNMLQQSSNLRLWYFGPFFRYERPTAGRLRQFHQYGAECIGSPNPESDAEVIMLATSIIKESGISDYKLLINTLGNPESRKRYRDVVREYFNDYSSEISEDSKIRLEKNPLRILDSKDKQDEIIVANAPLIKDYLDEESSVHFENVLRYIRNQGIGYEIQPRLVRGLDYYSHTVFEFQSPDLGAYDSFGGGGRYDGLFSQMQGKPTPAVGFAMGVERMLLILEKTGSAPVAENNPDVFLIAAGPSNIEKVLEMAHTVRRKGYSVQTDLLRRSVKAQFREANKQNAGFTIVIGDDEIAKNEFKIKKMSSGEEYLCSFESLEQFNF